jgi:hypothetical protein
MVCTAAALLPAEARKAAVLTAPAMVPPRASLAKSLRSVSDIWLRFGMIVCVLGSGVKRLETVLKLGLKS